MGTPRPNFDERELVYQFRRQGQAQQLAGEYRVEDLKFLCTGMSLAPPDLMGKGKFPLLKNTRVYQAGVVESRPGQVAAYGFAFDQVNVHSLRRLDDPTNATFARVVGAGTKLYVPETGAVAKDVGYSGNPLALVQYRPEESPLAWMYVGDSNKMRKVRGDGTNYAIGIAPPNVAPSASLAGPVINILEAFDAIGTWTVGGTAGALATFARVNTTIAKILYDAGATGMASVVPASMNAIEPRSVLRMNSGGGTQEDVRVAATFKAVANSTIESIQYDVGATGLCTIQAVVMTTPDVKLAPNQTGLNGARLIDPGDEGNPDATGGVGGLGGLKKPTPIIRQPTIPNPLGLYPDAVVLVNAELVRVLSVTPGPSGRASFRCSTVINHAAGEAITGQASFRAYMQSTHAAAETITTTALTSAIGAGTGWLQNVTPYNLAVAGGRAVQPQDEIHIAIRIDNIASFVEGRLIFDVDPSHDFAQNYYFIDFRANDLIAGLAGTTPLQNARQRALQKRFTDGLRRPLAYYNGDMREVPFQLDKDFPDVDLDTTGDPSQTPTGATQWFDFHCKVSDLQRVGTDKSKGLADVGGIRMQFQVNASTPVYVDGLWIGGTYGPDVGDVGNPMYYRFRYRSSVTGARSNPSPAPRAGISPHRERVAITAVQSPDPQVDKVDYYRFGGDLTGWMYVGSSANGATPQFFDEYADVDLIQNEELDFECYQPFPTLDTPRSGTCNVVGTSVGAVAGDNFNVNWAPGTVININGRSYALYAQPATTTFLELTENAGTQAVVPWFITSPVLLGQPLPVLVGPLDNFILGMGDKYQPGTLFWMRGNDPDTAPETNSLEVTAPSEPLINAVMFDGRAFLFTPERCFVVMRTPDDVSAFRAQELPVGKGLYARWGLTRDLGLEKCFFIAEDGIYETLGGPAISITGDLAPLFPHDGQPGVATNGIVPPDFTQVKDLRLSITQSQLYFDFKDVNGNFATLVYDMGVRGWISYDVYGKKVQTHYADEGAMNTGLLMGANDGKIYQLNGTDDAGATFPFQVITPYCDGTDARQEKAWGDAMLDFDSSNILLNCGFLANSGLTGFAGANVSVFGRDQSLIDVRGLNNPEDILYRNLSLSITGDVNLKVRLYGYQFTYIDKSSTIALRPTDWLDEGYAGAKFFQGFVLDADTGNVAKELHVVDSDTGTVQQIFNVQCIRQTQLAFSFAVPFIAHKVRLAPNDQLPWRMYSLRFVWEPCPELVTDWITQGTTHDLKGFQHVHHAFIALQSTTAVTLTVTVDGVNYVYNVPSTAGVYLKQYVLLKAVKGKVFTYALTSGTGFRLFQRDSEVGVKTWGDPGPYQPATPFGDIHRLNGARI